jgi:uncharacterized SAM-binding protein YcdF (DUF218 family)
VSSVAWSTAAGAIAAVLASEIGLGLILPGGGSEPLIVAGGAALGALLARTRLRLLVPLGLAVLLSLWIGILCTPLASVMAADLVRRDPPALGDAVFVLNHDVQADGDLSGSSLSRLFHAVALVVDGSAPRLVIVDEPPVDPPFSASARRWLDRLGIDVEIVSVSPAKRTREEAVLVGRLARERGWTRILVVTSPLHSRRACAVMETEGLAVVCSPSPEPAFDLETLGKRKDRFAAFRQSLRERASLSLHRWRGWID